MVTRPSAVCASRRILSGWSQDPVETCLLACEDAVGTQGEAVAAAFEACISTQPLCFSFLEDCMWAELFGEEADGKLVRPGLLEMADGGTLYLDEVADMPLSTQARILRVLTEQSFVRVGGNRQIGVDMRVVSSTSREKVRRHFWKLS